MLSKQTGLQWSLLFALFLRKKGRNLTISPDKGVLVGEQGCPISPIIHSEEVLISGGTQLITVTLTKTIGSLVSIEDDTAGQLPPNQAIIT